MKLFGDQRNNDALPIVQARLRKSLPPDLTLRIHMLHESFTICESKVVEKALTTSLRCLLVASLNGVHFWALRLLTVVLLIALLPTVIFKKIIYAHNAVRLKQSLFLVLHTIARDGMKYSPPAPLISL